MKIAVIGTGYVGLVSGVCLAANGHDVTCVDIDRSIVDVLNRGRPTIYERGLAPLLAEVHAARRFRATTALFEALDNAVLAMIAVGTPSADGVIDLRYVREASRSIGEYLRCSGRFLAVVVKSTVLPGTTDTVVCGELEAASGKRLGGFGLGMNPEFLREGEAVNDFMNPDRLVFGYEDQQTLALLEELYAPWQCAKLRVNTRTAELIKYANNVLLATQISTINEIANLAAALGSIDVMGVVKAIHLDKRWNPVVDGKPAAPAILSYLVPGCGFGGSCFPKDLKALRTQGRSLDLPMRILGAVVEVNEDQPRQVVEILERETGGLAQKTCLVLGLAFKPGTDDVRESSSIKIVDALLESGARLVAHDPMAAPNFKRAIGTAASRVSFVAEWRDHLADADVIVVATKWPEYEELARSPLAGKIIFDARRMYNPADFEHARYFAIGRDAGRPA